MYKHRQKNEENIIANIRYISRTYKHNRIFLLRTKTILNPNIITRSRPDVWILWWCHGLFYRRVPHEKFRVQRRRLESISGFEKWDLKFQNNLWSNFKGGWKAALRFMSFGLVFRLEQLQASELLTRELCSNCTGCLLQIYFRNTIKILLCLRCIRFWVDELNKDNSGAPISVTSSFINNYFLL